MHIGLGWTYIWIYSKSDLTCDRRVTPSGARDVPPESVAMVAYPLQQLAAFKADGAAQRFGLRLRVGSSGWTEALPLEGAEGAEELEARPALLRAAVPAWGALYELVARLELLGSDFERTLVRAWARGAAGPALPCTLPGRNCGTR